MKKFLLLLVMFFYGVLNVNAASNPYSKYETLTLGEDNQKVKVVSCTWYAWKMASENADIDLPSLGNASNWYDNAKKKGFKVGSVAKPNSIVVYKTSSKYGHVAYVTKVDGTYMYINEAGIYDKDKVISDDCEPGINELGEEDCVYSATITYKAYNGDGIINNNKVLSSGTRTEDENSSKIIGFIYLDEPVETTTKINKETTTKINKETTTIKSSSITTTTTKEIEETTSTTETNIVEKLETKENKIEKKNRINIKIISLVSIIGLFLLIVILYLIKKKNKKH